jgi:hypothetical protein
VPSIDGSREAVNPRFRRRFVTPSALAFIDWAARLAGSGSALDRGQFEPNDVKPWLGALAILQWDPAASDYRYRLFGTNWAESLGRDLTGRPLAAWPANIAQAIRDRVHTVVRTQRPIGAQVAVARTVDGQVVRGHTVFEQVLWPLSYGRGTPPAILALAVAVPEKMGLSADSLREATGRLGHWFDADGVDTGHAEDRVGYARKSEAPV